MSRPAPLPAPAAPPPLRRPEVGLPAYRYVPGLQPHPIKGIGGHRHLVGARDDAPLGLPWWAGWRFGHGLDLIDHGYYWEAHEALEHLWHGDPDDAQRRALLQGLIQAAASALTLHLGRLEAGARLAARSVARLRAALPGVPGLEGAVLRDFIAQVEALPEAACPPSLRIGPTAVQVQPSARSAGMGSPEASASS